MNDRLLTPAELRVHERARSQAMAHFHALLSSLNEKGRWSTLVASGVARACAEQALLVMLSYRQGDELTDAEVDRCMTIGGAKICQALDEIVEQLIADLLDGPQKPL